SRATEVGEGHDDPGDAAQRQIKREFPQLLHCRRQLAVISFGDEDGGERLVIAALRFLAVGERLLAPRYLSQLLLVVRRDAWEQWQESVRRYDPQATLPTLKAARRTGGASRRRQRTTSPCALIWRVTPASAAYKQSRRPVTHASVAWDAPTASPIPKSP